MCCCGVAPKRVRSHKLRWRIVLLVTRLVLIILRWIPPPQQGIIQTSTDKINDGYFTVGVQDNLAPEFESAAATSGNTVTITFDEYLNSASVPDAAAFSVDVGGGSRTVTNVAISGKNVELTIDGAAITDSDTVTVSYTKPGSGTVLEDRTGNQVSTLSNENATTVPDETPTITIADVAGDNTINHFEYDNFLVISGTTTMVANGQILTMTLNGKDYQATVSGDAWSVDVPAADVQALAAGNHSVTANVTNAVGVAAAEASKAIIYNSTAPLTITLDDTALAAGETATVTFTFNEAVTGFDNSDITLEGGTLSAVTSADDGITWTATFTPTADISDATNLIKVGYDWTYVSSGNAPAVEQVNAAFTTVAPVGVTVTGNSITKTAGVSW